jgi:hypothetical protein
MRPAGRNLTDAPGRHPGCLGQWILSNAHRRRELLSQQFTRRPRIKTAHGRLNLVLINDLDRLRVVARWCRSFAAPARDFALPELLMGNASDVGKAPNPDAFQGHFCIKTPDEGTPSRTSQRL